MKKIFYYFFITSLFYTTSFSFSQVKLSGVVYDSKDKTPLAGVSVKILNKDSVFVTGTESDISGFFLIDSLQTGIYQINFSLIGYKDKILSKVNINENSVTFLDTIFLVAYKNYEIEEVQVESDIPQLQFKDEKKVFNIEQMTSIKGGNAIDVLRKIPMIEVDNNDNIILRGSSNIVIYLDNKPIKSNILKQIPADAIKSIEIITNPSAKYEAEGVTGIINIITLSINKNIIGYNGFLATGINSNSGFNANTAINISKNKWRFFLNGGGGKFASHYNSTSGSDYFSPVGFLRSNSFGNSSGNFGYGSVGFEYEFAKKQNIGFESYINFSKFNSNGTSINSNYTSAFFTSSYYNNNTNNAGDFNDLNFSLYYSGKYNDFGKELNLDLTFTKGGNTNDFRQFILYYDSTGNLLPRPSAVNNNFDYTNKTLRFQVDYTHPLSSSTKFEVGTKSFFRENDNDYLSDTLDYLTNQYERNYNASNHFRLQELINSAYITFSHKINLTKFKLGLRAEHTHSKGDLFTNNSNFEKNYLDLFPTISISQQIGISNELQLSYSRRITRPNVYRLNPFAVKYSDKYISFGNPQLNPEFTDSYELNHNLFTNIFSITTSIFFRRGYDLINNYTYLTDSNIAVTTYKNLGGSKSYGLDLILNSSYLKWLTTNANFSIYNTTFDGSLPQDIPQEEGVSWKMNFRTYISIGNLVRIDLFYTYVGKKFNATGYNNPYQTLDIAISKSFLNRKLNISIRSDDILKTRKWTGITNGIAVTTRWESKIDARVIYLSINYNFGNTDSYYQKSKKVKQNENEQQDQIENKQM
ncbi:MAG: TonB-dependent receptor domain-containing protein [Ignavibacteria bacterium]